MMRLQEVDKGVLWGMTSTGQLSGQRIPFELLKT